MDKQSSSRPPVNAEADLMAFVNGFKRGVCCSGMDAFMHANAELMAGYHAGRAAMRQAYSEAARRFGTILAPLR